VAGRVSGTRGQAWPHCVSALGRSDPISRSQFGEAEPGDGAVKKKKALGKLRVQPALRRKGWAARNTQADGMSGQRPAQKEVP